jgi:hypothetical protein
MSVGFHPIQRVFQLVSHQRKIMPAFKELTNAEPAGVAHADPFAAPPNSHVTLPPGLKLLSDGETAHCGHYIRHHSHAVGNCLSAMELQVVLVQRTSKSLEDSNHLAAVRNQIGCVVEMQQRLGLRFRAPVPAAVCLASVIEQCQSRQRVDSAERALVWSMDGGDCRFYADAQAVSVLVVEIADHFFRRGGGTIHGFARDGSVCFQMRHPADSTSERYPSSLATEIKSELSSIVVRYGGFLVGEVDGNSVEVAFPQVELSTTQT